MTLTLSVCHAWGNPTLTLCSAGLTALIARVSILTPCVRGWLSFQSATPPLAPSQFLPLKDPWGQRIRAAGDKRAHVGSMPACLAITTERAFARPLLRHDKGCQRAQARMVSAWGAISQQVGWVDSPGSHLALSQRSSPFFLKVHDELTKSWCAPYSSRIGPSASAALTSVDAAEEKGYWTPAPSGWVHGRTSLPAHGYRMEGEGEPSFQAVQSHICTRWMHLLRRLDKRLRHCTLWLCSRSSRPRYSPVRKPVWMQLHSGTWGARTDLALGTTKATAQAIRAFDVQPDSFRAPPQAHDDGDERGGQSSLPRLLWFLWQPVWTICGGLCGMLHGSSEVVSSNATLPPETHQLFYCFQLP